MKMKAKYKSAETQDQPRSPRAKSSGGPRARSGRTKGLDHVAIAVKDLDRAIAFYRDALGLEAPRVEEVPEQQVKTAIFGHGRGRIELICPTVGDSGVARFLEKRGEGLHHICIEVEDLDAAIAELKQRNVPLTDAPQAGAGGSRVAFIHPKGTGGVLVELKSHPPDEPLDGAGSAE